MLRKQFLFTLTVDVPYLASHWRLSRAWMLQGSERFKVVSIHPYPVRYLFKIFFILLGMCLCVSVSLCMCLCVRVYMYMFVYMHLCVQVPMEGGREESGPLELELQSYREPNEDILYRKMN